MAPGTRAVARQLAIVAGIVILFPRLTWPHAELLRSQPAAGSVIESVPRDVHIWFSEPVDAPSSTAIRVVDPEGTAVAADTTVAADDRTELTTRLTASVVGSYTVHWRAISADGHPIDGTFVFSVGHATTPVTAGTEPAAPTAFVGLQAIGRWLHLLALSLLIGPLGLMLLGVFPKEVDQRLWTLSGLGAVLLIPAAAVMFVAQSAAVTDTFGDALRIDNLRRLLITRWGLVWVARTSVAIALTAIAVRRGLPGRWLLTTTVSLVSLMIVTTSLNSHAGVTPPVWLSLGVDWAHTAASGMWIGGLFALATVVLPWTATLAPPLRKVKLAAIVPSFSLMALVCVQILFVSGMYQTWAHVSGPAALTATSYGLALLVKLGLVTLTMFGGAINLFIVKPRLTSLATGGTASSVRLFRRVVSAEALLMVTVLASVAVLTSLPPASAAGGEAPRTEATAAPEPESSPALSLVGHAGTTIVMLSLASADIGSNRAIVALQGGAKTGTLPIRLRIEPPRSSGMSASTVTPDLVGPAYHATLALAPAGDWTISVIVTSTTQEDAATFHVTLPLSGARELLALADQRMNTLRSVAEDVETIASGGRLSQQYEYQAPDLRLHKAEILEITAGDRHFMRHGTTWQVQTTARFVWPSFRFAENARDVAIAGHETVDGYDCVVVSYVEGSENSPTNLWIATDTVRVIQQVSATPAGLVTRKFTDFDRIAPIRLPEVPARAVESTIP